MIISFVGTQQGMTKWQEKALEETFTRLAITELCIRDYLGSDSTAIDVAIKCGVKNFHIFPIRESRNRAFRFPHTNKLYEWIEFKFREDLILHYKLEPIAPPLTCAERMVEVSELCVATPKEFNHVLRSGTWAAIRKFWHKKKEVITIPPIERDDVEGN